MGYRELIKKVQDYSGFSDSESKDALDLTVESLSVHLNEHERIDFASQLPTELQNMALAVLPTEQNSREDMVRQFMELQKVDESRAKKQIIAAWQALKDAMSKGELEDIRSQLPNQTAAMLHA